MKPVRFLFRVCALVRAEQANENALLRKRDALWREVVSELLVYAEAASSPTNAGAVDDRKADAISRAYALLKSGD